MARDSLRGAVLASSRIMNRSAVSLRHLAFAVVSVMGAASVGGCVGGFSPAGDVNAGKGIDLGSESADSDDPIYSSAVYSYPATAVGPPAVERPSAPGEIVGYTIQNNGSANGAARLVTVGQSFVAGHVPPAAKLEVRISGARYPVQMDVKTKHADGSVRMAILSFRHPMIPANAKLDAMLLIGSGAQGADVDLAGLSGSFPVRLHFTSGPLALSDVSIDVFQTIRDAVANGSADVWLKGPLATQARVMVPIASSLRLIFDVTRYADGSVVVDTQIANDGAMGPSGGTFVYDVDYGGVASASGVRHVQYARLRKPIYLGSAPYENVQQDVFYLIAAKVVLPYDLSLGVDQSVLASLDAEVAAAGWNSPFSSRGITQYMPMTGGRRDIGPLPSATTVYVITQDQRARDFVLGWGEAAGGVPWHFHDQVFGRPVNLDDRPTIWTDGRGSPTLTQGMNDRNGWDPDTAHQPELAYLPYMTTGVRYFLDELTFQAAFNLVASWNSPRQDGVGNLIAENQVRGAAWGLRELDLAAWANPEGTWEQAYFKGRLANNLSWVRSQFPVWNALYGETHGMIPGVYGAGDAYAPWQQDYFMSTVVGAARHGSVDALAVIDWMTNWSVGRFTNQARGFNLRDGVAYNLPRVDANGAPISTWAQLGSVTAANGQSNGAGWGASQGDYGQLGLMSLALVYTVKRSVAAKQAYAALKALAPPYTADANYRLAPPFRMRPPPAP